MIWAQKTPFFAILGVKKFFQRRIRVFQLFLPLEMMLLEKNFFEKMPPKMTICATFFAPPCIRNHLVLFFEFRSYFFLFLEKICLIFENSMWTPWFSGLITSFLPLSEGLARVCNSWKYLNFIASL